ncbi:quinolinate synthase NadA [Candidatus Woesearchaeota archaeon]|nr:quinolinate synthase NadA [Candidatus Woesearchaeota archaeon]
MEITNGHRSAEQQKMVTVIKELKRQRNALILVHNYQDPAMYEIADLIGDSLGLAKAAVNTSAEVIVMCGVRFMAEMVKILNPEKIVILPTMEAGCSLADMATAARLREVKHQHPDAAVVSYVNTSAEIKAFSDVCCTSANAVQVVNSLPQDKVIFLPDRNLGSYVQSKTRKRIILWDGYCFVHDKLDAETLQMMKRRYPGAKVIAHPEAKQELLALTDYVSGTGGMARFAKEDLSENFIIVTECGMTDLLRHEVPEKNFLSFCNVCPYMKSNSLSLVARSLATLRHEITLPEEIIVGAKRALDRMMAIAVK